MRLRLLRQGLLAAVLSVTLAVSVVPAPIAVAADDGWPEPVSSRSDAATDGCADYLYIGVRGSGESNRWGSTVNNAEQALKLQVRDLGGLRGSVRSVFIDYTAASVDVLGDDLKTLGLSKRYLASVVNGYLKLNKVLADSYDRCRKRTGEKWIIAGYSQGALVASQVLGDLTSRMREQVLGVQLIADPANWKGRSLVRVGKDQNRRGRGVWTEFHGLVALPKSIGKRVFNVCDHADLVCDFDNARVEGLHKGAEIHGTYARDDRFPSYFRGLARTIVDFDRSSVRKVEVGQYLIPEQFLTISDPSGDGTIGYGYSPAYGFDTYNHNIQCYIAPYEDSNGFVCAIGLHNWAVPKSHSKCARSTYIGLSGSSNSVYGSDGASLVCGHEKLVPRERALGSTASSGPETNPVLPAGHSITAWGVTCTASGSGRSSSIQCHSKTDSFRIAYSSIAYDGA